MLNSKRLVLAHFWLAFAVFGLALLLGEWQMFVRSPLNPWISNSELYYRSVTAHGSAMGYVFPTLIAMGFGYAITEFALKKPLIGRRWAWAGLALVAVGAVTAMIPVSLGLASILYTFYPPMIGNPFYYIGVVLVVVGSWIWVALMSINMAAWKRENPGKPVPLAMFANVAGAYLWGWTAVGAAIEVIVLILPVALGLEDHDRCRPVARVLLLDAARHRLFLADADLHRLLHDLSAGDRRAPVQRRHGPHRLHPVRRGGDADRRASSVRRSAGRRRLQVHSIRLHGAGGAADAGDDLHDLRVRRTRRPAARRQGPVRLGRRAALGQSR